MKEAELKKILDEIDPGWRERERSERRYYREREKYNREKKEIISRYKEAEQSQELMTFQEYCLRRWMNEKGIVVYSSKITDAKVQEYIDKREIENARNGKAADPEYEKPVESYRKKKETAVKKRLELIMGDNYHKIIGLIKGKTILTASNVVFFDMIMEKSDKEWKSFIARREVKNTDGLMRYFSSDCVLEEIIFRGFQSLCENKSIKFTRKVIDSRLKELSIEVEKERKVSKTCILAEVIYYGVIDFDYNYDRKENEGVFRSVDEALNNCLTEIVQCLEEIDCDTAHEMEKNVRRQLYRYGEK